MLFLLEVPICSDFVLATILVIVKRVLNIIQIIVPILLIISGTLKFLKMTVNPDDDKKGKKNFLNSIISAIIIFLLPMVMNLTLNMISEYGEVGINSTNNETVLNLATCWQAASTTQSEMDSVRENGGSKSSTISKEQKKNLKSLKPPVSPFIPETNPSTTVPSLPPNMTAPANSGSGKNVVKFARQYVGNPYAWGGNSLETGTDCSGFIVLVYAHFGLNLPRSSTGLRSVGKEVASLNEAIAGDIICYEGHVALFSGDGMKIIHAKGAKYGIVEDNNASYKTIVTIRRVMN